MNQEDNTSYWFGFFLGFFFSCIGILISMCFGKETSNIRRGAGVGTILSLVILIFLGILKYKLYL